MMIITNRQLSSVLLGLLIIPAPLIASTLTLDFYTTNGAHLSFKQVQAIQTGEVPGARESDALINPTTLQVIKATPMTDASALSFSIPDGQPAAVAINWPTATQGYGMVIIDNGGKGYTNDAVVNFTYQAAEDAGLRLNAALNERRDYIGSSAFQTAYRSATNHLHIAQQSDTESVRGSEGQLALDQFAVAYDVLLREYGPQYARSHLRTDRPWLGFTLEEITGYRSDLDRIAEIAGPYAWVRIVFQHDRSPSDYKDVVAYAAKKRVKVLGLPVDSSADKGYTREEYFVRCTNLIALFPTIGTWEVGNEVNGDWCSADIATRVADVAAFCKTHQKKTYLTLFWQLNTSAEDKYSLFNWIAGNLPATTRANLDYIGISQYQEQAPVGLVFDQIMRRLQQEFSAQQIGLGELGYWIPHQSYWWAYSHDVKKAKQVIVDQYYNASLGYARAYGGCFWWNFASGNKESDFDATMVATIKQLAERLSDSAAIPVR